MPLISTLAGAAARAYGFLTGAGRFFIGRYSPFIYIGQTASDSAGNLYIATRSSTSDYSAVISKFNSNGTSIAWQKTSTNLDGISWAVIQGTDTLRITGYDKTDLDAVTISLNSSGVVGNSQKLSGTDVIGIGGTGATDGNTWVLLQDNFSTVGYGSYVARYDAGQAIQWQRKLSNASVNIKYIEAVADSSNNVYIAGYTVDAGSLVNTVFVKYNSAGTLQWQKIFTTNQSIYPSASAIDSSANFYAGFDNGTIIKFNSSGAIQWQKKAGVTVQGIAVDSSGSVYCTSSNTIYKYLSDGTASAKIDISASGALRNPSITENNAIFTVQDDTRLLIKIPTDGSLTGTYAVPGYASVTYSVGSFSPTTPTYAITDSSYTSATSSLTDSPYSVSLSDIAGTLSIVNFG